jgi:hypothetical protein
MPTPARFRWKEALAAPLLPFAVIGLGLSGLRALIAVAPTVGFHLFDILGLVLLVGSITAGGWYLVKLLGGGSSATNVAIVVAYVVVMLPLLALFSLYAGCILGLDCL